MERLKKIYDDLSTTQKILVLVVICVVLLILNRVMSSDGDDSNSYTKTINYKEITTEEILSDYTESYSNRDLYLEVTYLIEEYCSVYTGENKAYKEYYEVVDSNYSKYLSRSKFTDKMNSIISKIKEAEDEYTIKFYVHNYSASMCVVEILCNDETAGYIGFILDSTSATYSIFYIE